MLSTALEVSGVLCLAAFCALAFAPYAALVPLGIYLVIVGYMQDKDSGHDGGEG